MIYFCTHTYDSIVFCCGTKNDGFFTKRKNNYYISDCLYRTRGQKTVYILYNDEFFTKRKNKYYISDCLYRTRGQKTVYILYIFKKHLLKKTVLKIFSEE